MTRLYDARTGQTTELHNPPRDVPSAASVPDGMVRVSRTDFFRLLAADPRDIMPHHGERYTTWETKARERWGWTAPGWKNAGEHPDIYAVERAVLEAKGGAR